jgi:DNA-packaging protein gp3
VSISATRFVSPSHEGLAEHLNVHRDTLYDWASKYRTLSDILERIKALQVETLLNKGLSGTWLPPRDSAREVADDQFVASPWCGKVVAVGVIVANVSTYTGSAGSAAPVVRASTIGPKRTGALSPALRCYSSW